MKDAALSIGPEPPATARPFRVGSELLQTWLRPFASGTTPMLIAIAGAMLVASVGYLAVSGTRVSGQGDTLAWVVAAGSAAALGLYATARASRARTGRVLAGGSMLWATALLLASGQPTAFTLGWLLIGLAVPLLSYEMLASSTAGALLRSERLLLVASSALVAVCWGYLALSSRQPTLLMPLAKCAPSCPRNVLFVGAPLPALATLARAGLYVGWLTAAFGVAVCIVRRHRAAGAASRRCVAPILIIATANAVAVAVCVAMEPAGSGARVPLVWVCVIAAAVLPFAMLAGLVWEQLFMGEALEEFVNRLRDTAPEELPSLMAQLLHDPSLQIGYSQPAAPGYVDPSRSSVELPDTDADAAVMRVEGEKLAETVVVRGGAVADHEQERFIRAAGAAALISYENHRLEADLSASVVELAASRKRLVEAANAERQRIERDLHDGIQQRMVGARVKLELAEDAMDSDPTRGRRMLDEIGCDMDDALEEVRSLAQGVYPALLATHGLVEALRSAARRSPGPVTVRGDIARYPPETEAAVYFCCLETLQNVAKHAGRGASATVRLWQDGSTLLFETHDTGVGFTPNGTGGRGLINMRDRLAAVGGNLTLSSRVGVGTVVGGYVPLD